jgi:prophage tail gpP-like protein
MIRPENNELTVLTDGRELGGWTAVAVDRGLELLPSNFRVDLTKGAT